VPGVVERLTIDHVGQRGDGVSLTSGASLFVPYTLAHEIVETERDDEHPERRRLLQIDTASPERIDPFCTYFTRCGGCAIQHWQPDPYQAWKRQIVIDTLAQAKITARSIRSSMPMAPAAAA
jgi:23S rRNA (uracil1939-C5)-methyltransferase